MTTTSAVDAEMTRALSQLQTARFRVGQYARAFGGAVERDLERRLADALRQVRHLEAVAALALLGA
jgi:hypothetical protein